MIGPWLDTTLPVFLPDPVNRHHPQNQGRVAWYLTLPGFDGGKYFYNIMGMFPGTLTNMTTSASGWRGTTRPGGLGHLLFDGADDSVVVNDPAGGALDITGGGISFGACVFPTASGNYQFLVGRESSTVNNRQYSLFLAPATNQLYVGLNGVSGFGPSGAVVTLSSSWVVNAWNHVFIVYNGSNVVAYLNGKSVATVAATGSLTTITSASVVLGKDVGGYVPLGSLDDVAVISRAWSATEVAEYYRLSCLGYPGVLNRVNPAMMPRAVAAASLSRRTLYDRAGSRGAA